MLKKERYQLQWKLHLSSNDKMIWWYAWFPDFPAPILKWVSTFFSSEKAVLFVLSITASFYDEVEYRNSVSCYCKYLKVIISIYQDMSARRCSASILFSGWGNTTLFCIYKRCVSQVKSAHIYILLRHAVTFHIFLHVLGSNSLGFCNWCDRLNLSTCQPSMQADTLHRYIPGCKRQRTEFQAFI